METIMTDVATTPASADAINAAIADLRTKADRQSGCPFELWTARLNLEAQRLASALSVEDRAPFLDRAATEGLYDPEAETGWTITPTEGRCAHGFDPGCCPCGCDDIDG
jgi:hypothetical protein